MLQGAASPRDFSKLQDYLATKTFYAPLDPILSYERAADLYFNCRRQGITIRGTIHCLIAQIAIEHNLRLLHSDRYFTQMAAVNKKLKLA